jgi:hypothetical protein
LRVYLRVTRTDPVAGQDVVARGYRRHWAAMSREMLNVVRMALFVLRERRPYVPEPRRLIATDAARPMVL